MIFCGQEINSYMKCIKNNPDLYMVLLKRSLRKEENKKRIQKTNFFIDVIITDDKLSTYIGFKVKNNIKD